MSNKLYKLLTAIIVQALICMILKTFHKSVSKLTLSKVEVTTT